MAMNICQAEISALKTIRQALVIDAQQMHQRGLKIMNMHAVVRDVDAKIIAFSILHAGFHTATGHP